MARQGERWRSTEPDQERSGVQRDGSRGRGTDGTETRTLGKSGGEGRGAETEIPREPLRGLTQRMGEGRGWED